jgi:transcriptional regulator
MTGMMDRAMTRELKKGSAELMVLSLLETGARHGYELSKLIAHRSGGRLALHIDSLYPLLYRLEDRGWIRGAWVEKPGERRRRCYSLTRAGRRVLAEQRRTWDTFVDAVRRITRPDHA